MQTTGVNHEVPGMQKPAVALELSRAKRSDWTQDQFDMSAAGLSREVLVTRVDFAQLNEAA